MGDDGLTLAVVGDMVNLENPLVNIATAASSSSQQRILLQHAAAAGNDEQVEDAVLQQEPEELDSAGVVAESFLTAVSADDMGLDAGQQILTIDGKQLFFVTADGNFAAVTADCLENGGLSISEGGTEGEAMPGVENNTEAAEGEGVSAKKIKLECPDGDNSQEQPTEKITLENGMVFGIYNTPGDGSQGQGIVLAPEPTATGQHPAPKASSSGRTPLDEDADPTQAWFTTKDDKQTLTTRGHSWKQGQWGKDEVDVLQNNINAYCTEHNINDPTEIIFEMSKDERKDFYRTVARGLNRPLFSVYRRVIRMYDQKNHIGKYTQEEITRLRELRTIHGNDWAKIGSAMGRSASSVKDKCRLMRDMCNSGKWLPAEEKRLAEAVYSLSGTQPGENVTSGLSWACVSERVVTRSEKQCRTKWLNYLNWKQQGGSEWTRMDDIRLMDRIAETGVTEETEIDWNELTENWSSVRSPQWLRGKWWTLKRHIQDYQILPFQELVTMAREFHTLSLRASLPGGSTAKPRQPKVTQAQQQQQLSLLDPATQYVVSMPDHASLLSGNSGTVVGDEEDGGGLISYEVLPHGFGGHPGTAFLITQPRGTDKGAGEDPGGSGDHIILHTLPIAASTASGGTAGSQGELAVGDLAMSSTPTGQQYVIEEALVGGAGDRGDKDALQHIHLTTDHVSHPGQIELHDVTGGGGDMEDVVGQEVISLAGHVDSTSGAYSITTSVEDANSTVIDDLQVQPVFTRSTSDLIHMSSLSDPMLPSDTTDLMTEIETEKTAGVHS